jgi:hypothetical protein
VPSKVEKTELCWAGRSDALTAGNWVLTKAV